MWVSTYRKMFLIHIVLHMYTPVILTGTSQLYIAMEEFKSVINGDLSLIKYM